MIIYIPPMTDSTRFVQSMILHLPSDILSRGCCACVCDGLGGVFLSLVTSSDSALPWIVDTSELIAVASWCAVSTLGVSEDMLEMP